MRLIDAFDRAAALWPANAFVRQGEFESCYADSAGRTHRIAAALQREGHAPGTRIGIYTANDWRGLEAMLGVWRAGCVLVPVNVRNSVQQNAAILRTREPVLLFYHSAFAHEVEQVIAACPSIRAAVCLDRDDGQRPGLAGWMAPEGARAAEFPSNPLDPWTIYSTSGTTGASKGVAHTHLSNLVTSMDMLFSMRVFEAKRHLVVAPMTHFAGTFIFALTMTGSTHVLLPRVDPAEVLETIERERIQVTFMPPTVIYALLAHPDARARDYRSLEHFVYAAAPMAADKLKEAIAVFGPVMMNMYGQAEAIGPISYLRPEEHRPGEDETWERRLRSIGRSSLMRQVDVMREDGTLAAPGEAGEVVVRSWVTLPGYLDDPQATEQVNRHGWYHTGDVGAKDAEGYVTLLDRKKDVIITGGFNVYSVEVEQALMEHEAVLEACVIGIPDEKWGEAVHAVVELKPGRGVEAAELIELCRRRVGSVSAPKRVEFRETLPRSATGKVLKRELRDAYWAGRERRI